MIKSYGIDFNRLPEGEFDSPLGISSGAGDIFGTTGGVMEATLARSQRTGHRKTRRPARIHRGRAVEGLRETYVAIGDRAIHVGVANGLTNAKTLLEPKSCAARRVPRHRSNGLSGGCIGGGGQPYPAENVKVLDPDLLRKRAGALYAIDKGKTLRKSYENPAIEEVTTSPRRAGHRKSPSTSAYTLSGQNAKRRSMSTTTDNWDEVQAVAKAALTEPLVQFIDQCRQPSRAGQPTDCSAARRPGAFRILKPTTSRRSGPTPSSPCRKSRRRGQLLPLLPPPTARKIHDQRLPGHRLLCERRGARRPKSNGRAWHHLGETSKDGVFTLEGSRCLGTCGLAPVIMINDEVHAQSRPTRCRDIGKISRQIRKVIVFIGLFSPR